MSYQIMISIGFVCLLCKCLSLISMCCIWKSCRLDPVYCTESSSCQSRKGALWENSALQCIIHYYREHEKTQWATSRVALGGKAFPVNTAVVQFQQKAAGTRHLPSLVVPLHRRHSEWWVNSSNSIASEIFSFQFVQRWNHSYFKTNKLYLTGINTPWQ